MSGIYEGAKEVHTLYFVYHEVPGKKKMEKTRWRMSEDEAAKRFKGVKYELCQFDTLTIDPSMSMQGNFTDNWPDKT